MAEVFKIDAFECPTCSELVRETDLTAHMNDCVGWTDAWQCASCDELYESEEEAKECCTAD